MQATLDKRSGNPVFIRSTGDSRRTVYRKWEGHDESSPAKSTGPGA
ncbi:MAG: hypothetical protein ACOX0J_09710 [Thermoactinomyces vulgaris]|jgi:hypothetical protein|nr:hypothetical protein [Thermoactinomyces vulgaris]